MARGRGSFNPQWFRLLRRTMVRDIPPSGRGLTLDEVAAMVGTTRQQIIAYEQGRAMPEPARLAQLAKALGCSLADLTGVDLKSASLIELRRAAGLTRRQAVERLAPLLADHQVRCSAWLLGEAEAGRTPAAWLALEPRTLVSAAMAKVYGVRAGVTWDAWQRAGRERSWRPRGRDWVEERSPAHVLRKALAAMLPPLQYPEGTCASTEVIDTIVAEFDSTIELVDAQLLKLAAAEPGGPVDTALRHLRRGFNHLLGNGSAQLASTEFSRAMIALNRQTN